MLITIYKILQACAKKHVDIDILATYPVSRVINKLDVMQSNNELSHLIQEDNILNYTDMR